MKVNEYNYIKELRNRNEKALDYVIDNYGWIIKSVVGKHLYGIQSVQEECINDVLLGIWNNINSFDESKSDFKNWVAGICKFKCIDYKRKYLKDLQHENIEDLNISDDCIEIKNLENEQHVISSGPYSIVRHPMYLGMVIMTLFMPLALGSYFSIIPMILIIPITIIRIKNEEETLLRELKGYKEYCLKTHYRLIPLIW